MIHIMYGLPASGKTTLAMELFEKYKKEFDSQSSHKRKKVTYCNCDEKDRKTISNTTDYGVRNHQHDVIIVDGFFKIVKSVADKFHNNRFVCYDMDEIVIHVFEQNKQACFENDKLRNRKELSTNSINEGIEKFDIEKFKLFFFKDRQHFFAKSKIKIVNEKVISYNEKKPDTIYSSWLVGEDISNDFVELDNWLEENYPQITFLQYKKICKHIKENTDYTQDYYDKESIVSLQRSIKIGDILKEVL